MDEIDVIDGTVLSYCAYWLAVMVALIYMKWSEGRLSLFGHHSPAGHRRLARQAQKAAVEEKVDSSTFASEDEKKGLELEEASSVEGEQVPTVLLK